MAKTLRGVDLEPIERLEDKVRVLVTLVSTLKAEQARLAEDNRRLTRDVETLTAKLADAEGTSSELAVLRDERDEIRRRVTDMLDQLGELNL